MFNLVRVGKEWAGPVFPHPLTSNFMFYAYSRQGNLRLAELFPTPLTICTTVFARPITFWTRLISNLVRVGNELAGPVFPHTLTSNFMFYVYSWQGNLRLSEFFPTPLTICTTVFPDVITLCIMLMFNIVRVGKEWADPVPPPHTHTHKKQRLHVYSWQGKVCCVFRRRLTICTTVFPHPITFWTRLMFNLARVGKEWAGPVFSHPLTSNFMFYAYFGQGNLRLAQFYPTPLTICTTVFPTW